MGIFSSRQPQAPDPRIFELTQLVKESAAAITILEKEIEAKDEKIGRLDLLVQKTTVAFSDMEKTASEWLRQLEAAERVIEEYKKQEDRLIKEIYRLRSELKKRTEQYNDLVDLAREKGVISD